MKKYGVKKKLIRLGSLTVSTIGFVALASIGYAASDAHGGGHANHWLTSDTWKVLNFTLLVIIGFLLLKKPAAQFFSSRKKNIADEINELEQKKAQAQKELASYQAKFKNLDQESKEIVDNYIKQGEEAKARIIAEAKAQAEKLEEMAKNTIEQEFKSAKASLQLEISEMAMERAEEIIKTSISAEDQDKLVDQYLEKVVA